MSGPSSSLEVRPARPEERAAVEALLVAAELPVAGVADHFERFLVLVEGDAVTGAAGLEVYGSLGLIRSVVIDPSRRGRGHGANLVARIVGIAKSLGVVELYLLTTTATAYFEQLGFAPVERSALPEGLGDSAELRGACPSSARAMIRHP